MNKPSQYQGIKETLTDIDGNAYPTVQISTQVWTAKDLKVTHYRNGEAIPYFSDIPFEISYDLKTGIYCDYDKEKAWHRMMGFTSTKAYRNKECKSSYLSVRLVRDKVIAAV